MNYFARWVQFQVRYRRDQIRFDRLKQSGRDINRIGQRGMTWASSVPVAGSSGRQGPRIQGIFEGDISVQISFRKQG